MREGFTEVDAVSGSGTLSGRVLVDARSGSACDTASVRYARGVVTAVDVDDTAASNGLGHWILPTLSNAHDHGRGLPTLSFGAHDQALELWIPQLASQPDIPPGMLATLALCKLARSGVGSVVHCHNPRDPSRPSEEAAEVCSAATDVGVRLAYVVPMVDRNGLGYGDQQAILSRVPACDREAVAAAWQADPMPVLEQVAMVDRIAEQCGGGLIDVHYGPVGPQWASPPLLRAVADASAASGRRVHMHLFETKLQREWADATFSGGLINWLDEIGLLSPRLTVAHGVWLRPDEMALLAERGVTVSVNTSSNLRLRSGLAPVEAMRSANVRIAFGLDGMSLDDDEDALRELRLTQLLHGGLGLEQGLSCNEALALATSLGHEACGTTGHGRVEAGAPADLMRIDRSEVVADVSDHDGRDAELILARARARHVTDVVVDGRPVVRSGCVVGADEAGLAAEVAHRARSAVPSDVARLVPLLQAALEGHYRDEGHRRGDGPASRRVRMAP